MFTFSLFHYSRKLTQIISYDGIIATIIWSYMHATVYSGENTHNQTDILHLLNI